MDLARTMLMVLGLVAIIGGVLMVFFEVGLDQWISMNLLIAGLLIFAGMAVLVFAGSAPFDPPHGRERRREREEERAAHEEE